MRAVYEKNVGVDLEKEVQVIEKTKKLTSLFLYLVTAVFVLLFICAFVIPFKNPGLNVLVLFLDLLVTFISLLVISALAERAVSDSKNILEAFEKVIQELDPSDLNPTPIRSMGVLTGEDIKGNMAKLARKLLLLQANLEFLRYCSFAGCFDVDCMEIEEKTMNERFSTCIEHAYSLGIDHFRDQAILDAKKLSGVPF